MRFNYDEFVKNFPNSEFNTHLQDMKIGIYNIVGDHDKFIIGYSKTLQKVFDKIYQKQSLNWLDKVNLESPPLIFSQNNNFIRPAFGDYFIIESEVQRFGRTIAIGETKIYSEDSRDVICHATSTYPLK